MILVSVIIMIAVISMISMIIYLRSSSRPRSLRLSLKSSVSLLILINIIIMIIIMINIISIDIMMTNIIILTIHYVMICPPGDARLGNVVVVLAPIHNAHNAYELYNVQCS